MTFNISTAAALVVVQARAWAGTWGPALLALVVASAGAWLARRRPSLMGALGALAVAAGWATLVPAAWRWVLWPRATAEWLLLPALVLAGVLACAGLAGSRIRSRWWTVAAVCFGAWWLARSPAGMAEFWRVEFGAVAVAWVLTRGGAGMPGRGLVVALAVALATLGGVVVGSAAGVWVAATLVLVAGCLGMLVGGRDGAMPPGLLMLGLVGVELGAGRVVRGGLGVVDLACLGALGAPVAVPFMERRLRRRVPRVAGAGAALGVAALIVGIAWMLGRVR